MTKTQEDFFIKYLPLTLLQGFEKVVWGLTVRGSWRSNITAIFWPQTYSRHVVSFLFSWCSTRGLGAHSAGWSATSYQQLLRSPNSIGVPEGPLGFVWLSLPHLISNWPGTPLATLLRLKLNCLWLVELNWVI